MHAYRIIPVCIPARHDPSVTVPQIKGFFSGGDGAVSGFGAKAGAGMLSLFCTQYRYIFC